MTISQKVLARPQHHYLRRSIHLTVAIYPFLYYWYKDIISAFLRVDVNYLIVLLVIAVLIIDSFRIRKRRLIISQREYEKHVISSLAWTTVAVSFVLLFAPRIGVQGAGIGVPLILSLAVADPLMGESRILNCPKYIVALVGLVSVALVWLVSFFYLQTPWQLIPLIAPLTVAAEMYSVAWVDDNAMMLLVPLLVLMIIL